MEYEWGRIVFILYFHLLLVATGSGPLETTSWSRPKGQMASSLLPATCPLMVEGNSLGNNVLFSAKHRTDGQSASLKFAMSIEPRRTSPWMVTFSDTWNVALIWRLCLNLIDRRTLPKIGYSPLSRPARRTEGSSRTTACISSVLGRFLCSEVHDVGPYPRV